MRFRTALGWGAKFRRDGQRMQVGKNLIEPPRHIGMHLDVRRAFLVETNAKCAPIYVEPLAGIAAKGRDQAVCGIPLGLVASCELGDNHPEVSDVANTVMRVRVSSEVRRVGKACVSTCISRWSLYL